MPPDRQSHRSYIALPIVLGVLCAGISLAGYRYYEAQRRNLESDIQSQLSAIADLKIQQILTWRRERMADAVLLAQNPLLEAPPGPENDRRLNPWLEAFRSHVGYTELAILDGPGQRRVVASDGSGSTAGNPRELFLEAVKTGQGAVSDLYKGENGSVYIDFLAAFPARQGTVPSRALLIRVEASAFLYAMIQAWPVPSETAECLLIRREGNKVRFLTALRHGHGTRPATLPVSGPEPAARAARDEEGIRLGPDYRGVPVMAALRQVPGTAWALVVKVDAEEIYAPLRQRSRTIGLVVGLLLAGCLSTFGFLWHRQQNRIHRRQRQAETERYQSVVREIAERKRAEVELLRVTRAMRVLSASNQAVVRAGNETDLYHDICRAITETGGYPLAWIGFAMNDERKSVQAMAASGRSTQYLENHGITWDDGPRGRGPVGCTVRTGAISVSNDVVRDENFGPWREKAACYGFKAAVSLPLHREAAVIGALSIYACEPDAFQPDEIRLLRELAGDLSYGIEARRRRVEQQRAEEALRKSEIEFRAVFDNASDAIFILDLEGRILEANTVASQRLGYSRDELLQMTVQDLDTPAYAALVRRRLEEVAARGEALFETEHRSKDGLEAPVEINGRVFEYRRRPAILSVARDVSERKRSEALARAHAAELERAKSDAEKANRAKSQFLANMSHEIRTPMNGILGTTGLLFDTPLTPDQRDWVETIRISTDALLAIVNGILDLSKIEAGKMELEPVDFDIVDCLKGIYELMAPQARAKSLHYVFQSPEEHRWVRGDAGRLRQVALNLLSNAVKFTDHGQVTLGVTCARSGDGQPAFTVFVADTGIGMAGDDLPLLFGDFTQLDSSPAKKHQGSGLGLAISHQLASLMGGSLTATSELGKGSTFSLTLPLRWAQEPGASSPAPDPPPEGPGSKGTGRLLRVLLAEDNMVNQKVGARLLEKRGCRVDVAANGREAVEMADRFPYDLILMDCGMPEVDGFEATKEIRARQRPGGRIPIVALTAHVTDGIREQCLAAGMDDYIAKPVSLTSLERALHRWRS